MHTTGRTALLLALSLAGCGSPDKSMPPVVSDGYRPAAFADDQRLARVEAAFPGIGEIFRTNAERSHYVGQVWGAVVDGELVLSDTFGVTSLETQRPADIHSKFHIASLTKSFTSMAILKLRDSGQLSLQDPVALHLPELAGVENLTSDAPPVVIEQLMTMTSGFPEDNPWADRQLEDTTEELLGLIENGLSFSSVPGSGYEYSNLGYAMLGTIITRASGRPYQRYITEEILEPLGMFETYWDYRDVPEGELAIGYRWEDEQWKREPMLRGGAFGSIGGLITSLHDMGKYVGFHLSAWPPRSGPDDGPVRRSTVREMHVPTMPRLAADAVDAAGEPCPYVIGYGYGLGIRTDCRGTRRISHTGGLPGFGSNIQFFPDHGIGLISFANLRYGASSAQHTQANALLFEGGGLAPRSLPVSGILEQRAPQVAELVTTWDETLGEKILADNFYLDLSRDHRMRQAEQILARIGPIHTVDDVVPLNQLRGTFVMHGENGDLGVSFTLSPERPARVQRLDLR